MIQPNELKRKVIKSRRAALSHRIGEAKYVRVHTKGHIAAGGVPACILLEGGYAVAELGSNVASFISGFN